MSNTQKQKNVAEKVAEIALPIAESLGFELWDVKFVKEGGEWYLRIFIDKEEGITLEDCENMSRKLDEPLDLLDPVTYSYCLEVCSPGIERELSTDAHLERFIGHDLTLKLFRPDEQKRKRLSGKLESFDKEKIILNTAENSRVEVIRKNVSHINLKVLEENE